MASFQTQVMGLTDLTISSSGTNPTEAQLTQFLTDGAKEIINILPPNLLDLCSAEQTFTSTAVGSEAETLNTGKVSAIFRNDGEIDQPCRRISDSNKGRFSDPSDMSYATITDPVYYIANNKINALPDGGSCKYTEVQYPAVAYSNSAVAVFPDEAEYLVVLYGAIKALQHKMGNKTSDLPSDLTIIAVPPDTPTITVSTVSFSTTAPSYASPTTTISGVNWVTEYPSRVSDITTALGLINTAVGQAATAAGKFLSDTTDSVFGDEATFLTSDSQLTRVKDALDNAEKIIDDGANSPTGNAAGDAATYLYTDEDTELLQGALGIAQSEIQRAQIHLSEWTSIGDMRVKEVQAALAEAGGYVQEVQALLSATPIKIQEYQSKVQDALNEFNDDNAEYQAQLQISIQDAQLEDAEEAKKLQKYSAELQQYASEVQTEVQEFTNNIQKHTVDYQWLDSQYQKLSADYQRGIQMLTGGGIMPQQQQ